MSQSPTLEETPAARAKRYRAYAEQAVAAGNLDYAIELFCSAIATTPDDVSLHQDFRTLSLRRKAAGGRSSGLFLKYISAKATTEADKLAHASTKLAYDPGNTLHMVDVLSSAERLGLTAVRDWTAEILRRATHE